MIIVIDYGMGNLRSVAKAIEYVGGEVKISSSIEDVRRAERIVLPGVGAFGDGMKNLVELGLSGVIREAVLKDRKPFLGICLGMQLLAQKSFEFGETAGLGLLDAQIVRIDPTAEALKIPHVGWDDIEVIRSNPLFAGIRTGDDFYFVHSYYMQNRDPQDVAATCTYGVAMTAAVKRGNIFATQFHPEKSQEKGLRILENFIRWESERDYVENTSDSNIAA